MDKYFIFLEILSKYQVKMAEQCYIKMAQLTPENVMEIQQKLHQNVCHGEIYFIYIILKRTR